MFKYFLILAAGKGERMLYLTTDRPKALVDVNGRPLISYTLEQIRIFSEDIFITIGYKGNEVVSFLSSLGKLQFINTNRQGNTWWLHNSVLKDVDEPILVFPCDIITYIDFNFIYRNYQKNGFPACLIISIAPVDGIEGDYIFGENGKVTFFSRNRKSNIYCSGIHVVNPYKINRLLGKESKSFYDMCNLLIEKEQLYYSDIYPYDWHSINTPEQLERAKIMYSNNQQ